MCVIVNTRLPECFKSKKKTMKFEENFVEPKNSFK